ncbi:hypothetical protein [Bradyrhizobium japonicum]|uniref:hypothetical protein n=1 Tax=Bradyrhizobium japonicum TaxID=375 RepID=UPI001B8A72A1|nr:hypothetical protein [Bradyrhizobium japonicum]MBR0969682.1 hypothetical protein [Bradyrhizobium japonicum]
MGTKEDDEERQERAYRLIGEIVAQTCARHYLAPTQEHQFTSKITALIERELHNMDVHGMHVKVHAQDFPDKGRGSWEKKSGADVYISLVVDTPDYQVNKGMIVQSKWNDSKDRKGLAAQVRDMKDRTTSSYVWAYGPSSISVVPADDVAEGKLDFSSAKTVGQLISDGLRCHEGDPKLGRDLSMPVPQSLTAMMEKLALKHGLSITLSEGAEA